MFRHSFEYFLILVTLFISFIVIGCDFQRPFTNDVVVSEINTSFKSGDTTYEIDGNNLTATMTDANTILLWGNNRQNPVATVTLHPETVSTPVTPRPVARETAKILTRSIIITTPGIADRSIRLGQNIEELERKYGSVTPGTLNNGLRFNSTKFGTIEITLDTDNTVEQIWILDSKYKTNRGVGIGDLRHRVRTAHGTPAQTEDDIDIYLTPDRIGLGFAYRDGKVSIILLGSF